MSPEDRGHPGQGAQEGEHQLSARALEAWRADPDPARAVELCAMVRQDNVAGQRELAMTLARDIRAQCSDHLGALLSVARMYIVAEALNEAQSTLVAAANVQPAEPRTFALLGQVMLRLGDARRAVLAFEQATSRGLAGPATRALFDRALHYAAIQDAQGEDAVAAAVRSELAPGVVQTAPPPAVRRSDPPESGGGRAATTKPPSHPPRQGSDPPRRPAYARTLIGFGGADAPQFDEADVEKVLSKFVDNEERRASSRPPPSPSRRSDPPARFSERPANETTDPPPTTRYSVIKPEARTGKTGRNRSDRPADRRSAGPEKHHDFGMDTWKSSPAPGDVTPHRPGSRSPPRSERSYGPPSSYAPGPYERVAGPPRDEAAEAQAKKDAADPKRVRNRRITIGVGIAVVALFGIEAGRFLERAESARAAGVLVQEADKAMHAGSVRALADAETALRRAHEVDPKSMEVALATVNARLLRALDADDGGPGLNDALDQARALAAPGRELAAAEIVAALAARDGARADEVVRAHDEDTGRGLTAAAFYELAAGAALERRGDVHALERFQAAVRADPSLFPAEVRLVRAQLLYGDVAEGRRRARALPAGRPETAALGVLATYVSDPSAAVAGALPAGSDEDLPRTLRGIVRALSLRATTETTGRGAAFAATIESADVPVVAMFCGQLALAAGEAGSAEFGAKRALALSGNFAPALTLLARTALARGEMDKLKEVAVKLTGKEGAELRAIVAYEDGDATQMEEILRAMSPPAADGDAARLGLERLRGATLAVDRLRNASRADPMWGELLRVDVALDVGDLDAARDISDGWANGSTHPLRAIRLARRLRYEGRLEDARKVLEAAAATRGALIERALLAGELKTDRTSVLTALEAANMPEKAWLMGYLRLRQGIVDKATKSLSPLDVPDESAPRSVRIAAALALSEITEDRRGKAEMQRLVDTWPKNPDVVRAAVGFEILPKTALTKRRGR